MIKFDRVTFSYTAGAPAPALSEVSFEIRPGEMVGVLGANGSGKSTLARLANGLLLPDGGSVSVDGLDTSDGLHDARIRTAVGVVFQNPDDQIVATSVEDDVAFGPENLGLPRAQLRERVDSSLAQTGLSGLERREPHLLSGGQKQRLAIAGALAMQPRYLVLDEPLSMIDAEGRHQVREVLQSVRTDGHAILLITHDLAEVMVADRVIVLDAGRAVFLGSPLELLDNVERFREWGIEMSPLLDLTAELRTRGLDVSPDIHEPDGLASAILEHAWR